MTTTQVFQNGDSQMVRLPLGFEFAASEVAIRREGEAVILEPLKPNAWPEGFFEKVRIDDAAFRRPNQPAMPPAPQIESS